MIDVVYIVTVSRYGTPRVHFHANIVQESVLNYIDTSTNGRVTHLLVTVIQCVPDIDGISTEVSHVALEHITLYHDMRLASTDPIG